MEPVWSNLHDIAVKVISYFQANALLYCLLLIAVIFIHFLKERWILKITTERRQLYLELIFTFITSLGESYRLLSITERSYFYIQSKDTGNKYQLRFHDIAPGNFDRLTPESTFTKHLTDPLIKDLKSVNDLMVKVLPGMQWRDQATLLVNIKNNDLLVTLDHIR